MKKFYLKSVLFCAVVLFSFSTFSQSKSNLWTPVSPQKAISTEQLERMTVPAKEMYFDLNLFQLKQQLQHVGNRNSSSFTTLKFPSADGKLNNYSVQEASVMHPDLQARYPDIRSYIGQGIDNPSEIIRFSITPKGFHGMILGTKDGTQFINPFSDQGNTYSVFTKRSVGASNHQFECDV